MYWFKTWAVKNIAWRLQLASWRKPAEEWNQCSERSQKMERRRNMGDIYSNPWTQPCLKTFFFFFLSHSFMSWYISSLWSKIKLVGIWFLSLAMKTLLVNPSEGSKSVTYHPFCGWFFKILFLRELWFGPRWLLDKVSLVAQMVKNPSAMQETAFNPWVGKSFWRRAWQPTPVFLPGESHWAEEPGGLQSMESQRVRQEWSVTKHPHAAFGSTVIFLSFGQLHRRWGWSPGWSLTNLFLKMEHASQPLSSEGENSCATIKIILERNASAFRKCLPRCGPM